MFSSSQFDSNSAFSGGGFMTTQATQFNYSSPSPAKVSDLSYLLFSFSNFRLSIRCLIYSFSFPSHGASWLMTRETHGLVPVTVKQISEASHSGYEKSSFVINCVDLTNVTLVGMVFEKAVRTTDVGFILDDGTGRIKCQRWAACLSRVNETFDANQRDEIQDGMYVRVYGHLKSFQGVTQLVAFSFS
ncbi:hypothetical protein L6164_015831 [Bauhinia variegata]|uniref:Uncharacterized protein n=1 Tax=Bauhinia variegata TaxID=167791 RepID=A0ACB9NLT2_BAUVA|nr:hypothetical protein L6164_015831 [Bauhinia variegata]